MIKRFFSLVFILTVNVCLAQTLSAELEVPEAVEAGSDFIVKVTVNKSNLNGFMKYFQKLPKNYTASNVDSKGGAFTFKDSIVKIIWLSPPNEDAYSFIYKIKVPADAKTDQELIARIDYTIDLKSFTFPLAYKTIKLGPPVATSKVETTPPPPLTEPPAVVETPPVVEASPVIETPPIVETPPVIETPPVVERETIKMEEYTYSVQIGAFAGQPKSKITDVRELKKIKLSNGVTKYLTGNYNTREEAERRRDELKATGFSDAFIIKLKDGKLAE